MNSYSVESKRDSRIRYYLLANSKEELADMVKIAFKIRNISNYIIHENTALFIHNGVSINTRYLRKIDKTGFFDLKNTTLVNYHKEKHDWYTFVELSVRGYYITKFLENEKGAN